MTNTKMLKSRQKQLVDLILKKKLSKRQFEFTAETNDYFILCLKNSDLYFKLSSEGFRMKPGLKGKLESGGNVGGFVANLPYFETWLDAIHQELEIGDPWEDALDSNYYYEAINQEYEGSDKVFAGVDLSKISEALQQIQVMIIGNQNLSGLQINQVRDDIRRLEENSAKITAKDWYLLFTGQMFSWLASGFLTPDQPRQLFELLSSYINFGVLQFLERLKIQ